MSRYRRAITGSTFFFTVVAFRRRPILCGPALRASLRRAVQTVRASHPFEVDGWVLLPDHMHCIWTLPPGDSNFSIRWSEIKRFVSSECGGQAGEPGLLSASRKKHRESTIWQRRFWEHRIRDAADMDRHLDYVHFNPVRHGYAKTAAEWQFSTFRRYVGEGVYALDWGGAPGLGSLDFE